MNSARKGNSAELRVSRWYRDRDWLVASRRHEEGPGDLTANRLGDKGHLTEVKSSSKKRGPFADFPPADRDALRLCAIGAGMVPVLAWSPSPTKPPKLLFQRDWPG